jgi:hypothetical protein
LGQKMTTIVRRRAGRRRSLGNDIVSLPRLRHHL